MAIVSVDSRGRSGNLESLDVGEFVWYGGDLHIQLEEEGSFMCIQTGFVRMLTPDEYTHETQRINITIG